MVLTVLAFTFSAFKSFVVEIVKLIPFCSSLILSPAIYFTVSPGATFATSVPLTSPVEPSFFVAVAFQPLLATSSTFLSCETFTASVSPSPAFKPVIFLSPILMPLSLIVTPPISALFKPLRSFANFTFNMLSPSDSTPIFLSDNAPSAPPFTKI